MSSIASLPRAPMSDSHSPPLRITSLAMRSGKEGPAPGAPAELREAIGGPAHVGPGMEAESLTDASRGVEAVSTGGFAIGLSVAGGVHGLSVAGGVHAG